MTAWLRNCGEQPCPRNLLDRGSMLRLPTVRKRAILTRLLWKSSTDQSSSPVCVPLLQAHGGKEFEDGKMAQRCTGRGDIQMLIHVFLLSPPVLLHLNERQHASTYLGHSKHPKRLRWANTWQHKEVLCNEYVRGSNWSHSTA